MSALTTKLSTAGQDLISRSGERLARLDGRPLPHRLLLRAMPLALARQFDPAAARDLDAVFELRVRDPHGAPPTRFELRIADSRCQARPGGAPDPQVTATIGAADMIRLASGGVGWPELLANGRLELTGDPFLGLRFPMLFGLPAAPTPHRSISTAGGVLDANMVESQRRT